MTLGKQDDTENWKKKLYNQFLIWFKASAAIHITPIASRSLTSKHSPLRDPEAISLILNLFESQEGVIGILYPSVMPKLQIKIHHWTGYNYLIKRTSKGAPVHSTEVYRWSRIIVPIILKIGMRLRWVVSLIPQLLYPPGDKTTVPTEMEGLVDLTARWHTGRRTDLLPFTESKYRSSCP
jgi:hypothetical protein